MTNLFKNKLKILLIEKGKTQLQLVDFLRWRGFLANQALVSKWATNRTQPSAKYLKLICEFLRIQIQEFYQNSIDSNTTMR